MRRREGPTLAGITLAFVLLAGCAGTLPPTGSDDPTTTRSAGQVLTVSVANLTNVEGAPPERTAEFAELSDAKQEEFTRALDDDVREPTAWTPGTDVEYVRFEGTWYWVTVVVVN